MIRTRREYRLCSLYELPASSAIDARRPVDRDRDRLALLMLDAYRDTLDDEGESLDDARQAIDHYFGVIRRDLSVVVDVDVSIAACLVLDVEGLQYIDPIIVAKSHQRGLQGAFGPLATIAVVRS